MRYQCLCLCSSVFIPLQLAIVRKAYTCINTLMYLVYVYMYVHVRTYVRTCTHTYAEMGPRDIHHQGCGRCERGISVKMEMPTLNSDGVPSHIIACTDFICTRADVFVPQAHLYVYGLTRLLGSIARPSWCLEQWDVFPPSCRISVVYTPEIPSYRQM